TPVSSPSGFRPFPSSKSGRNRHSRTSRGLPIARLRDRLLPMAENSFSIDTLLEQMVAHNASDLHVTVGSYPALRVRGHLERLEAFPVMTADLTRQLLYRIISSEQQKRLQGERPLAPPSPVTHPTPRLTVIH